MNLKSQEFSILIVEDNQAFRNDLVSLLSNYFKTVIHAPNGRGGLDLYNSYKKENGSFVDIVLSDIEMPQMNGITMCKKIFEIHPEQLIIMLSEYTHSQDLITCINIGIYKFLTKPVDEKELFLILQKAFVKLKENKQQTLNNRTIFFDTVYSWDLDNKTLQKDGEPIVLTRHNTILLELFLKNQNLICTNDMITQAFYRNNIEIDAKNIRNQILKLRKKLPNRLIESIYGQGYKFSLPKT